MASRFGDEPACTRLTRTRFERANRFLEFLLPDINATKIMVCHCRIRLNADGLLQRFNRLVVSVQIGKSHAQLE
jgi:hypothetical protein